MNLQKKGEDFKKGSDPIIMIGIGSVICFVSIFLPYVNVFLGLLSAKGTAVPIGMAFILLTSGTSVFSIYKYNLASTKQELISARLIGLISTLFGGIAIFVYYISFNATANSIMLDDTNPINSGLFTTTYITYGVGFFGFILGTGLIFFGSLLITSYINYKSKIPLVDPHNSNEFNAGIKKAKFCSNCGVKKPSESSFCINCGKSF